MTDPLIQKAQEGNSDAFRQLIRDYKDNAYSLAVSVVKDEFTAKDVVQISFVKACTGLSSFRGNSKFSTWFYRIVYNEALTELRKRKRRAEIIQGDPLDENTAGNNQTLADPAGDNLYREKPDVDHQRYYINEALRKLAVNESLALRLFYLLENSIEEITVITGWSESNTRVILHRGRKNMKNILTQTYHMEMEDLYG